MELFLNVIFANNAISCVFCIICNVVLKFKKLHFILINNWSLIITKKHLLTLPALTLKTKKSISYKTPSPPHFGIFNKMPRVKLHHWRDQGLHSNTDLSGKSLKIAWCVASPSLPSHPYPSSPPYPLLIVCLIVHLRGVGVCKGLLSRFSFWFPPTPLHIPLARYV